MLKADFHIHSKFSMDCHSEPEEIVARCQQLGINCVAIADHDATEGAVKIKQMAPFTVIVAEEVLTPAGEVMGLFLKERIASGLSVEGAIDAIRAQGGLVCIPHPFDLLRGIRLTGEAFERIIPNVDIIEVFNARCRLESNNKRARDYARDKKLPGIAGSDAHSIAEIGNVIVELPEFSTPEEFLESLRKARINGKRSNPFVSFHSTWARIRNAF